MIALFLSLLVGQHISIKQQPGYLKLWDQIVIESHRKAQLEFEEMLKERKKDAKLPTH